MEDRGAARTAEQEKVTCTRSVPLYSVSLFVLSFTVPGREVLFFFFFFAAATAHSLVHKH